MKQKTLQMLKFVCKNQRKLKMIIELLVNYTKKKIGNQKRGKKRLGLANVMAGILYYLKTGCTWAALPTIFGNHKTIAGWFRRLTDLNIFSESWINALKEANNYRLLRLGHLLVDGSLTTVRSSLSIGRRNPRNKNKRSINRHLITDKAGMPLDFMLSEGTAHDTNYLIPLLDNINHRFPLQKNFIVHADKGYDSIHNRWQVSLRNGIACIPVRNMGYKIDYPKQKDKFRPLIERSFAWINSFKAIINIAIKRLDTLFQSYCFIFTIILSRILTFKQIKTMIRSI